MKKLTLVGLLCLLGVANLFAKTEVTVFSGDKSVLKTKSLALLEFDYSSAKVGDQPLAEYLKNNNESDWPDDNQFAISMFTKRLNKKSKGIKITENPAEASYKMVVRVTMLDFGSGAGVLLTINPYAGGCTMSGTVEIIDIKTNETVCVIKVDDLKGQSSLLRKGRLGVLYHDLATKISKLK